VRLRMCFFGVATRTNRPPCELFSGKLFARPEFRKVSGFVFLGLIPPRRQR
jgi:hypothetical protein